MNREEWTAARLASVEALLPRPYRGLSLSHEDVRRWCLNVLSGAGSSLILVGPKGTGKTASGWLAYRELIGLGWIGRFRAVTEVDYLDSCLGDGILARKAKDASLLLLDDLGGNAVSDWSRSRLLSLLDTRWLSSAPTIVTTNLTPGQVVTHLGDRASSRLADGATYVTLTGPDRRLA